MKKASYREPDYAFGQQMLTLRMSIGLTQAGLADYLGVSRHAVGDWEAGQSYPKAEHLKAFIALGLQQHVFTAVREAEEIRALWRAAHQKVLLDELWLQQLLIQQAPPLVDVAGEQTPVADRVSTPQASGEPRVDWGEALDVPSFYGREEELALLFRWVIEERCRVVSVLGMGGIGKSALSVTVMHRVASQFEVVIWRSLRDALSCDALLEECLQVLAPQPLRDIPDSLEGRLHLLMEYMRDRRVLLVLDNVEMLLEEGEGTGLMRAGSEGYARLLRRMGETAHQSCLLLTSREKPADLVPLEGSRSPVRALRLSGLDADAGAQLLAEKDVASSLQDRVRLVDVYRGNPLALKIVAQTIVELFGGEIVPFLEQGEVIFGGVRELLDEQFDRLSALEQGVFSWLAILREPVSMEELLAVLSTSRAPVQVLEALDGLGRRSLIERGQRPGSFTLQSVVLEYATARLIAQASSEIEQGQLDGLIEYGLCQAQAKEYVRAIQELLLVVPLLTRLQSTYQGQADLEARFLWLLDQLRDLPQPSQGYGPTNLVALLRVLLGNLRGLDLSRLALRGVSLQGVEMQDTTLAGSLIQEAVFTEAFDAINGLAISSNGEYWAASSRRGEVRVWEAGGQTLHRIWQAHTERAWSLAFSPDGRMLASGSWDGLVKLWEVESGGQVWSGRHTGNINSVAFAPDGRLLASGGAHETILWDVKSGTQAHTLTHPDQVIAVAWSPQGHLLATGDVEGSIRFWSVHKTEPAICIQTLTGHTKLISELAFSPDGSLLASGGYEKTIWLWDVEQNSYRGTLQGHTDSVIALAFMPDSHSLLSSGDSTLRLWDIASGRSIRVLQGNVGALFDVDWSPDGTHLVSGGSDKLVTISDAIDGTSSRVLRGHGGLVFGVGWSPDGRRLASSSWDTTIRLWDPATGESLQVLRATDDPITFFCGVAWSPDGQRLASTTYLNLPGVLVWDVIVGSPIWRSLGYPTPIRRVVWSPAGTQLAGGGDNGELYVWDANDGTVLQRLVGHQGPIKSVAWSPNGTRLVSAGRGRENGELIVWDAQGGERMQTIAGHLGMIYAVVWVMNGERGDRLVSGGSDGTLRWWIVDSGECLWVREAHQGTVQSLRRSPDGAKLASCGDDGAILLWDLHRGEHLQTLRRDRPYERLNITGIKGLSEAQKASLRALGAFEETSVGRHHHLALA
jgi:WD40 repeat protein/transcriptional regulator with XRE-family HTH domain